jgi:hypothetical protein
MAGGIKRSWDYRRSAAIFPLRAPKKAAAQEKTPRL